MTDEDRRSAALALAQMSPSELEELLKPGGRLVFESPTATHPEADPDTLACLAMRQAGMWGKPAFDADIDHPLFVEAVEAARSAGPNEQAAFDAATAILEGPEALEAFGLTP